MILVTGGAGYIGSHCVLKLLQNELDVVIFDSLELGHIEIVEALKEYGNVEFVQGDLKNEADINAVFEKYHITDVMHFAAYSQVGESMKYPEKYFNNNINGSLNLLNAMIKHGVDKIVFSSTAAVYGEPQYTPIDEKHPKTPINPYGKSKLEVENILDEFDKEHNLRSVRLRYFNVAGADSESRVGEWHDPETHLIPNILKSTFGNAQTFELYGDDYDTKDGTCIRDYINIEDLILAHLLALVYLRKGGKTDFINIGTSEGNSVKEVFAVCEEITEQKIPVEIKPRRSGDPAILVADNKKAKEVLGWQPQKPLNYSVLRAYEWETKLQSAVTLEVQTD